MWSWKTTRPKSQVTLWVGAHPVSHHLVKFGGHWHCGSWDNGFSLSRDLARPCDQRIMWIYWEESIKVSYLSAKFGGHRSYENRDINSHINSYKDTLQKDEQTASVDHMERFSKSGILIYNSKLQGKAARKTKRRTNTIRKIRRRTQKIAKCYAFYANAKNTVIFQFLQTSTDCNI